MANTQVSASSHRADLTDRGDEVGCCSGSGGGAGGGYTCAKSMAAPSHLLTRTQTHPAPERLGRLSNGSGPLYLKQGGDAVTFTAPGGKSSAACKFEREQSGTDDARGKLRNWREGSG